MPAASWLQALLFLPLLASGLLLPGWLLGRLVHSPLPWAGAFLGSAVVLFHTVLALDTVGIPLGIASLACALALMNLGLALLVWRQRRVQAATPSLSLPAACSPRQQWPWIAAAAAGLAAIALRATVEPLSGFDNVFRWDFLAHQMLREGTLAFYPPVTATDFNLYGWCDGIAPFVSVLDLWSYASTGTERALVTAVWVLLCGALLFQAVGRLAASLFGPAAAWPARAVLATSALVLWSVAIGQEPGLTALTLVAMLVCLETHRNHPTPGALFWAGLAAGAGGLCREYGLAWPMLGLLTLAWHGQLRQGWKIFGLTALVIVSPWYLRNWVHTGNPLYAHELGGLFPGNPIHHEYMNLIGELWGLAAHPGTLPHLLLVLGVLAGPAMLLGGMGWRRAPRTAAPLAVSALLVCLLWIWSVSQTAGGWDYSTRVLAPAIAVLAALGGGWLTSVARPGPWLAATGLVLAGDAALRSLHLPTNPLVAPWKTAGTGWLDFGRLAAKAQDPKFWKIIADAAAGEGVVVMDNPPLHTTLLRVGARPVPLFSPQLNEMYREEVPFPETMAHLRQARIRFVIIARHNELLTLFMQRHAFLRELLRRPPVFERPDISIYDLALIPP